MLSDTAMKVKYHIKKLRVKYLSISNLALRYKIIWLTFLAVLIPALIAGAYFYNTMHSILQNKAYADLKRSIDETNGNLTSEFEMLNNTYYSLVANSTIKSYLDKTDDNRVNIEEQMGNSMFYNNSWNTGFIKSIFLYKNENQYYYVTRGQPVQGYINKNTDLYNMAINLPTTSLLSPPSQEDNTIYTVNTFFDKNMHVIQGVYIFGINENVLYQECQKALQYKNSKVVIFNEDGIIFTDNDKSMLGKRVDQKFANMKATKTIHELVIESKEYYVAFNRINSCNLVSMIAVPKEEVFSQLTSSMHIYLIVMLIIILLSLISGIVFSSLGTKHIKDLMKNIKKIQSGDYKSMMPAYKDYDLNQLSSLFNKMANQISYLIDQVYEKQLLLTEAELKALQSQINPHFLFNVLLFISWKAKLLKDETIYRMVSSLSELLQASIYLKGKDKVKISEEFKYVNYYLYLQKERYGEKIESRIIFSSNEIEEYYIPKLTIQPIVENAIVHGLENKIGNGYIKIDIHESQGVVHFQIEDNGKGFDVSKLAFDIAESGPNSQIIQNHFNIGLVNTHKRLRIIYGEKYGITSIESEIDKGTTVKLCIPVDKGEFDVQHNAC